MTVGHLKTGDCIGEGMLRGNDRQPYTIVSMTRLRVGWVTSTMLRGEGELQANLKFESFKTKLTEIVASNVVFTVNEVEKHILSDKKFTLEPLTTVSVTVG